jgi:hypothetical protein
MTYQELKNQSIAKGQSMEDFVDSLPDTPFIYHKVEHQDSTIFIRLGRDNYGVTIATTVIHDHANKIELKVGSIPQNLVYYGRLSSEDEFNKILNQSIRRLARIQA